MAISGMARIAAARGTSTKTSGTLKEFPSNARVSTQTGTQRIELQLRQRMTDKSLAGLETQCSRPKAPILLLLFRWEFEGGCAASA